MKQNKHKTKNKTKSKTKKILVQSLIIPLIFLCVLLSASIFWMLDTWKNVDINEIIYHLRAPKTGTDSSIITGFIVKCIVPSVAAVFLSVLANKYVKKHNNVILPVLLVISVVAVGFSVKHVWDKLDVGTYIENNSVYSSFIDDHYVYPEDTKITFPEKKRNLIYIFLESMEITYADKASGGAFDENLIPNLTKFAFEYESFNGPEKVLNGGTVLNKTNFTMGGMYAQSMALPLILPIDGNAMWCQESFFPELVGIGDVLEEEGYQNTLLIGSHAMFGGRNLFYRDHGNYALQDYYYSIRNDEIPEDYKVFWGYEDEKLFTFAKKHILEDAASGQPFNMTLLTVDTHFEDGYFCQDCVNLHGENTYADVFNCSDKKIAEFVSWIQEQDFYENTSIVLVGDHLTMDSNFCKNVDKSYDRRVYLSIINGAVEPEEDRVRQYSTLDLFPTTLGALGVEIEGNRLGLGTNLYSSEPTLLELYGETEINTAFDQKSVFMDYLGAQIDLTKEELKAYEK